MLPVRSLKNQYRGINAHLHSQWQAHGNWAGFHTRHIGDLAGLLRRQLYPMGYVAEIEESLQVTSFDAELSRSLLVVPRLERVRFEDEYGLDRERPPAARRLPDRVIPYIEAMHAAIEEFWSDYDPRRPPKYDVVGPWLQDKFGLSERVAAAIYQMIRLPRPKKEDLKKQ